jgi:tetratricopeptide (TPR) repeat protein
LDEVVSNADGSRIVAIHGAPGVGKTTLALEWARRVGERFSDGVLFADLRGHTPAGRPADPVDVLEEFLHALDIPAEQVPSTTAERAALFRSILDGRQILVILDNAISPGQVRPMLPCSSESMTIVTSRERLSGLAVREGAVQLALDPFAPGEGFTLLRNVIGIDRTNTRLDAAATVLQRCAYLPLAVRLAAERIAAHPASTLTDLAEDLAGERARLGLLSSEDDDTAIRAVFSWSYRALSDETARMFRLLGLHPGRTISVDAAAALGRISVRDAERQLAQLANGHLLEEVGHRWFRFHDLVRLYALERLDLEVTVDDQRQARLDVLDWYLDSALAAGRILNPRSQTIPRARNSVPEPSSSIQTYRQALAWHEAELSNVADVTEMSVEIRQYQRAYRLALALFDFFHVRKPWRVWERTYLAGLTAAREAGEATAEASMLHGLGLVYLGLQRFETAQEHFQAALAIRTRLDEVPAQAWSLTGLAMVHHGHHDIDDALATFAAALELHRAANFEHGEAVTLIHLADTWREADDMNNAQQCCRDALEIFHATGDQHGEGLAMHHLGDLHSANGQFAAALDWLEQSRAMRREAGDSKGEADTLASMADVLVHLGHPDAARRHLEEALRIVDDREDPGSSSIRTRLDDLDGLEDSGS